MAASMRAFVKPPLEFRCSVVHWRLLRVRDSVAAACLSLTRVHAFVRFKVGVSRATEPVARSNFYPCRHQASHHIPHAREALGPNPGYQRAPSMRTVARRRPAAVSGALTFNVHDASFSAMFNNVRCLRADGFELRPMRDQPVLQVAPQRNGQPPSERHNADASQALAATGEASVKPLAQFTLRLVAQPAPSELYH